LHGWLEQRGRARAGALQEAAFLGLFRKGLDKEVLSSRKADVEQPARLFASFFRQFNNPSALLESPRLGPLSAWFDAAEDGRKKSLYRLSRLLLDSSI